MKMTTAPPTAPLLGQPPPIAAEFAARAQNLEALRAAVVEAAGVGAGLWFSYVFALLYLLIAAGSVTHRDLLLQTPIRLPFLGVDLPLVGFFALGPLLFLIAHAYVLLHLVLMAGKVGAFHAELQAQIVDEELRAQLRRQLPSNIFVQLLAGPREVRSGVIGFMLRLIAYVSLVAGPLALLVFFQLQFLPYRHDWLTWWHRLAVLADLVLLWMLWPSVARGSTSGITWSDFHRGKVATAALGSVAMLLFVFTVATFHGEWLDRTLPPVSFIPSAQKEDTRATKWLSLHELLIAGAVDPVTGKLRSVWSDRLVVANLDLIDRAKFDTEAKIAAVSETFSLRGRDLEGAVFWHARLRKVDFTAARLRDAFLMEADLRDAKFDCVFDQCADLRFAVLTSAQLQGASLQGARLAGAHLELAQLQGASLEEAKLQGAGLTNAELRGASLDGAQLHAAILLRAQLQGASLQGATLQGASLRGAQLQGASFSLRIFGARHWITQTCGAPRSIRSLSGERICAT